MDAVMPTSSQFTIQYSTVQDYTNYEPVDKLFLSTLFAGFPVGSSFSLSLFLDILS
jgi:hypothetical protein